MDGAHIPKLSKQLQYREVDNVGAIVGKFIQHTKKIVAEFANC
jgi:transcription antitermination factor NusA-like protein